MASARRSTWMVALVAAGTAGGACKPDLGAPPSLVQGPRVLAIRGTPAEAKPSATIAYDALVVDGNGRVPQPSFGWSLCLEPHPPAESNIVGSTCLAAPDDAMGETFNAPIPSGENDACMLFGPITPQPKAGEPPSRPADADVTGGYYQPVRLVWHRPDGADETAFTLERILCRLANAPIDVANRYAMDYQPNANPVLSAITLDPDGSATPLFAAGETAPSPATVAPGQTVTLEVAWPEASRESFLVYDVASHDLVTQDESLRVAWFVTGGDLAFDATGRTAAETDTFTRNVWTAPRTAGPVHLWVVVRDNRGGIDFAEAELDVTGP